MNFCFLSTKNSQRAHRLSIGQMAHRFSLGVTLDQCSDGLQVKTIDRRGALGRSGRVVRVAVLGPHAPFSLSQLRQASCCRNHFETAACPAAEYCCLANASS